jgi:hypothetical protein
MRLTPELRESLREELRHRLVQGEPKSEILSALATKYGITSESMSWFLRTLDEVHSMVAPHARERREAQEPSDHDFSKGRKLPWSITRVERLFHSRSRDGKPVPLAAALSKLTEDDLRRLISAKKLLPRLQDVRRKEKHLQALLDRLHRQIERARAKAEKIELRIQRIMEK